MTLKSVYPESEIDVLAPTWSLPLLERMPEVNQGIEVPVGHGKFGFIKRLKIGLGLRKNNYTRAIILPRSFKSALIPFFSGVPVRTGYRGEMRYGLINDIRKLDKTILKQTVQRYVALGLQGEAKKDMQVPYPRLIIDSENQQKLIEKFKISSTHPVVCFSPGAEYGPAKQWPIEKFAKLSELLTKNNYQVCVIGSQKEHPLGEEIKKIQPDKIFNLCGETSLVEAIDIIAYSKNVVTNDSGLMHVACATGRKIVAIYGSSTPSYTPPLSKRASIIYHSLNCSPCFKRVCPFGHTDCLENISVEEVVKSL